MNRRVAAKGAFDVCPDGPPVYAVPRVNARSKAPAPVAGTTGARPLLPSVVTCHFALPAWVYGAVRYVVAIGGAAHA